MYVIYNKDVYLQYMMGRYIYRLLTVPAEKKKSIVTVVRGAEYAVQSNMNDPRPFSTSLVDRCDES